MSGGGALGAYEAGVLYGMVKNGNAKDFTYDVVTGVSAGSINTMGLSLFKKGDESKAVDWLTDRWGKLTNPDVYKDWKPAGVVTGLTKGGIYDNSPLYDYLTNAFKELGGKIYRKITMSCVDVNDGKYITFDESSPDIPKSSLSSASIPGVFPPAVWDSYKG